MVLNGAKAVHTCIDSQSHAGRKAKGNGKREPLLEAKDSSEAPTLAMVPQKESLKEGKMGS